MGAEAWNLGWIRDNQAQESPSLTLFWDIDTALSGSGQTTFREPPAFACFVGLPSAGFRGSRGGAVGELFICLSQFQASWTFPNSFHRKDAAKGESILSPSSEITAAKVY